MIKTFIKERDTKYDELIQIDTENGKVKIYSVDKELDFPFSEYYDTVSEMGYKTIRDMVNRINKNYKEIETDRQMAKEVTGLLKLAKYRKEHSCHKSLVFNDGTIKNDIVERLKTYGMTETEALKRICYFLDNGIERHIVKVTYSNNDTVTTAINGTIEEIENYYKIGSFFNVGTVNDNMQSVTKLEFCY